MIEMLLDAGGDKLQKSQTMRINLRRFLVALRAAYVAPESPLFALLEPVRDAASPVWKEAGMTAIEAMQMRMVANKVHDSIMEIPEVDNGKAPV